MIATIIDIYYNKYLLQLYLYKELSILSFSIYYDCICIYKYLFIN